MNTLKKVIGIGHSDANTSQHTNTSGDYVSESEQSFDREQDMSSQAAPSQTGRQVESTTTTTTTGRDVPQQASGQAMMTSKMTSGASRAPTNGPDLGTYNKSSNQETSAVATGAGAPTFHQETQVYQSSVGGLNVQPITTAVNSNELYKDYLPNRNNVWLQNLITQMNSMSLEIDQYAKAQQEVISQEASEEINRVIATNKQREAALIAQMHQRAAEFEREYALKKKDVIAQLDKEQQVVLDRLQADLHARQQELAKEIKINVEKIGQLAKQKKVQILTEAQQKQDQLGAQSQASQSTMSGQVQAQDLSKHHLFDKNQTAGAGVEKSEHFHQQTSGSKQNV